jgi:hypothetical protein
MEHWVLLLETVHFLGISKNCFCTPTYSFNLASSYLLHVQDNLQREYSPWDNQMLPKVNLSIWINLLKLCFHNSCLDLSSSRLPIPLSCRLLIRIRLTISIRFTLSHTMAAANLSTCGFFVGTELRSECTICFTSKAGTLWYQYCNTVRISNECMAPLGIDWRLFEDTTFYILTSASTGPTVLKIAI